MLVTNLLTPMYLWWLHHFWKSFWFPIISIFFYPVISKQMLNHFCVCYVWVAMGKMETKTINNGHTELKQNSTFSNFSSTQVEMGITCKLSIFRYNSELVEQKKKRRRKNKYGAISRSIVATLIPSEGDSPDSNCQFKYLFSICCVHRRRSLDHTNTLCLLSPSLDNCNNLNLFGAQSDFEFDIYIAASI